jgi:hypothetical protein
VQLSTKDGSGRVSTARLKPGRYRVTVTSFGLRLAAATVRIR